MLSADPVLAGIKPVGGRKPAQSVIAEVPGDDLPSFVNIRGFEASETFQRCFASCVGQHAESMPLLRNPFKCQRLRNA